MTDDAALLTRIADGDREALGALYRAYEKRLFRFIRSRLNDPFASADILHDVFLEVWRSAGRFEGRSKVQTWIFGIAHRKVIDRYRAGARVSLIDEIPDTADDAPDPEACLAAGQEADQVRHCIEGLSADHATAIRLTFYEDMSYPQIAEVTGTAEGTIKTRVFHAKKLLMRCLEGLARRRVAQ